MNDFKKKTYSDQVVDYVKGLLLKGDLVPGAPIREVKIAEELSISRAPVREAMQKLLKEGLIEAHPQKVKNITALTAKQIKNSYFTGGVLEAAAVAKQTKKYTKEDIGNLESILAQMKNVVDRNGVVSEIVPLDTDFHDILFSRVDNDLLKDLCRRACQGISKFLLFKHWVKIYTPRQIYDRHAVIIEALKSKAPQTVERVLRDHYFSSGEKMAAFGFDVYTEP